MNFTELMNKMRDLDGASTLPEARIKSDGYSLGHDAELEDPRSYDLDDDDTSHRDLLDKLEHYTETALTLDDVDDSDVWERIHATASIMRVDPFTEEGFAKALDKLTYEAERKFESIEEGSVEEGSVEECGMGPVSPLQQQDSVSMNVSMNGSGKGGIRDLLDVLKNLDDVEQELSPLGRDRDDDDGSDRDSDMLMPKKSDLIDDDAFEWSNSPEEEIQDVDSVIPRGDDLHSNRGDHRMRQTGLPLGNPTVESLRSKLDKLYQTIKESTDGEVKVTKLPYKGPRKGEKTFPGSKHIGGRGEAKSKGRSTTGKAANTQGSPVVGQGRTARNVDEGSEGRIEDKVLKVLQDLYNDPTKDPDSVSVDTLKKYIAKKLGVDVSEVDPWFGVAYGRLMEPGDDSEQEGELGIPRGY